MQHSCTCIEHNLCSLGLSIYTLVQKTFAEVISIGVTVYPAGGDFHWELRSPPGIFPGHCQRHHFGGHAGFVGKLFMK